MDKMDELIQKLRANGLVIYLKPYNYGTESVVMEDDDGHTRNVDLDDFKNFFRKTDCSYYGLYGLGGPRGYKPYFDHWLSLGILSKPEKTLES